MGSKSGSGSAGRGGSGVAGGGGRSAIELPRATASGVEGSSVTLDSGVTISLSSGLPSSGSTVVIDPRVRNSRGSSEIRIFRPDYQPGDLPVGRVVVGSGVAWNMKQGDVSKLVNKTVADLAKSRGWNLQKGA